jgi:hypothetical protein
MYQAPRTMTYRWTFNGAPVPGATSPTLAARSAGNYACAVTASNFAGSTTQASGLFVVNNPPPPPPPPPPKPFPRIRVSTSGGWVVSDTGVRIVSMRIRGVPRRATVVLVCKACHVKQTLRAKKSKVALNKLRNKLLKRGQSFSVTVMLRGSIGDRITLTVKRYGHTHKALVKEAAAPFRTSHLCVPVGSKKAAKTCPAHA